MLISVMHWLYYTLQAVIRLFVCFDGDTVGLKDKFVARKTEQAVVRKVGDILVDCVCYLFLELILNRA